MESQGRRGARQPRHHPPEFDCAPDTPAGHGERHLLLIPVEELRMGDAILHVRAGAVHDVKGLQLLHTGQRPGVYTGDDGVGDRVRRCNVAGVSALCIQDPPTRGAGGPSLLRVQAESPPYHRSLLARGDDKPDVPWIVPVISLGSITPGICSVYLSVVNYFADVYSSNASFAIAAQSSARNVQTGVPAAGDGTNGQRAWVSREGMYLGNNCLDVECCYLSVGPVGTAHPERNPIVSLTYMIDRLGVWYQRGHSVTITAVFVLQ